MFSLGFCGSVCLCEQRRDVIVIMTSLRTSPADCVLSVTPPAAIVSSYSY